MSGRKALVSVGPLAAALFSITLGHSASADIVVEMRDSVGRIEIPVFDTSLGTLERVDLQVELRAGVTSSDGGHDHDSYTLESTSVSAREVFAFSQFGLSSSMDNHSHVIRTPSYRGGGLDIGGFALSSSTDSHQGHVDVNFLEAVEIDRDLWRIRAELNPRPVPGHEHAYNRANFGRTYDNGDVAPFLAAFDIVIPAGSFTTENSGDHSHTLGAFHVSVDTDRGPQEFFFPESALSAVSDHFHMVDNLRFAVTATFHYAAIPEPAAFLFGGLLCGILGFTCGGRAYLGRLVRRAKS
jgi:hypothetical protein